MGQTQPKVDGPHPLPTDIATGVPSTLAVFILGRQHSGNTVVAHLLGRLPGVHARIDESSFFELRSGIDRTPSPSGRANAVIESLRLEPSEDRHAVSNRLMQLAASRPNATALSLYLAAMDLLAEVAGAHTWVQKATSYIFHAREILTDVPGSRLIYMLRNPFDLAASEKRRGWTKGYIWGTPKGWSIGLALATKVEQEYPDRFRIVKYEDLVRDPEPTARRLCEFLGLAFDPRCLDVPRINPAEAGAYSLKVEDTAPRGLTSGKVYGYVDVLTPIEVAAVETMSRGPMLELHYPDRPRASHTRAPMLRVRARVAIALAMLRFAWTYVTKLDRSPGHLVRRTMRRLLTRT